MKNMVAPSILASDFANLQRDVEMLNDSEADWLHLDIMDGEFVPNISFGLPVCQAIARHAKKPLDVHLMIIRPERYLASFADIGAAAISVHYEACPHLHRTLQEIKSLGCLAGIAINPHTDVMLLRDTLALADFVNLMTVNPGFGGQSFINGSIEKVARLKELINEISPETKIEIDGGVDNTNASKLVKAGADILVAGSYVFKQKDPKAAIKSIRFSEKL